MKQSNGLARALSQDYEAMFIRQAELIRDWSEGPERREQAEIHVRWALLESGMRISQETLYHVYSILHFVMPSDAVCPDEPTPDVVLEQQAEWEMAYLEQLNQQMCEDCGDGLCPVEPRPMKAAE